jgi:hypothetical protein
MARIELERYLRGAAKEYHACIEACVECWLACEMCAEACLHESDVKRMVECIRLDRDCAEVCQAAVRLMVRGGELAPAFCRVCAEICDACAEECERHEAEHCQVCAAACRRCAEECRKMAGALAA